jgi:hypothetical protein
MSDNFLVQLLPPVKVTERLHPATVDDQMLGWVVTELAHERRKRDLLNGINICWSFRPNEDFHTYFLNHLGWVNTSGLRISSSCSLVNRPLARTISATPLPVACASFATAACILVPNERIQRCHNSDRAIDQDLSAVRGWQ